MLSGVLKYLGGYSTDKMTRGPGGVLKNRRGFSTLFTVTAGEGMMSRASLLVQNHLTDRGQLGGVKSPPPFLQHRLRDYP